MGHVVIVRVIAWFALLALSQSHSPHSCLWTHYINCSEKRAELEMEALKLLVKIDLNPPL